VLVIVGARDVRGLPRWYATLFSGFYIALLLILLLLIVRVVSFEWRRETTALAGGAPGSGRTRSGASAPRSSGA
jgi:cytochrome bd-type quinol oxidase subunit 2